MVHSAQGKGRILSAIAKWSLFYIRTATTGVLAVGSDVTQQFFHLLLAVFLKEKKKKMKDKRINCREIAFSVHVTNGRLILCFVTITCIYIYIPRNNKKLALKFY